MTITAENILSWPVALWCGASALMVFVGWFVTARVKVLWLRTFLRAAVISLCFTPLPAIEMFTEEGAMAGSVAIVPLWYVLIWSATHGALLAAAIVSTIWLLVAYLAWVVGISFQRLFQRNHP